MSWSIGFDKNNDRYIGYGVPSICDHPDCDVKIDRGLAYVCGGEPFGGEHGCGLHFCGKHRQYAGKRRDHSPLCERCYRKMPTFLPKPDVEEWKKHMLTDASWEDWRLKNPEKVKQLKLEVMG